jgi:transposase
MGCQDSLFKAKGVSLQGSDTAGGGLEAIVKRLNPVVLTQDVREKFEEIVRSRTSAAHHIERASILLHHSDGKSVAEIISSMNLNRTKIYRCIKRCLQVGAEQALDDLPRSGRTPKIGPEDILWLLSVACQAPKDLGYTYERWTTDLLAQHFRAHSEQAGHPSLASLSQGTVVKILKKQGIKPHKNKYYLAARDPDFDRKMVEVLKVYKLADMMVSKRQLATLLEHGGRRTEAKLCNQKKSSKQKPDKLLTRLADYIKQHKPEGAPPPENTLGNGPNTSKFGVKVEDRDATSAARQAKNIDELLALGRAATHEQPLAVAILSYDEKPGIQAIKNKAPDLPPVPGQYSCQSRDYEYVRCGTVSLLAGTDLTSGNVHAHVKSRHRSCEFVEYLKLLDRSYPQDMKLVILLDNHSAHRSKETQAYLTTVPDRFLFVFTPVHASWLNIIESFFSKMARSVLRGMRVASLADLTQRLTKYITEVNEKPVIFRWRYGLDLISA